MANVWAYGDGSFRLTLLSVFLLYFSINPFLILPYPNPDKPEALPRKMANVRSFFGLKAYTKNVKVRVSDETENSNGKEERS